MKKLLLIIMIVLVTGCVDVKTKSYDDIINSALTEKYKYVNIYREGYNYYLPKGLKVKLNDETSDIITDNKYNYYLYIDRISYHNKVENSYQTVKNAVFSNIYNYDDKTGYLEISGLQNDKYLIEIMYNYAKIEVIVDKYNMNSELAYSTIVLSSIEYNNTVIKNLIEKKKTKFKEQEYNIFSTINADSNILKYKGGYIEQDDNNLPDPDLID